MNRLQKLSNELTWDPHKGVYIWSMVVWHLLQFYNMVLTSSQSEYWRQWLIDGLITLGVKWSIKAIVLWVCMWGNKRERLSVIPCNVTRLLTETDQWERAVSTACWTSLLDLPNQVPDRNIIILSHFLFWLKEFTLNYCWYPGLCAGFWALEGPLDKELL